MAGRSLCKLYFKVWTKYTQLIVIVVSALTIILFGFFSSQCCLCDVWAKLLWSNYYCWSNLHTYNKCLFPHFVTVCHSQIIWFLGPSRTRGQFWIVQDKSDLKSASDKKIVRKAIVALERKYVNKTSHHAVSVTQFPAKLPLLAVSIHKLRHEGCQNVSTKNSCSNFLLLFLFSFSSAAGKYNYRDSVTYHLSNHFRIKTPSLLFSKICFSLACSRSSGRHLWSLSVCDQILSFGEQTGRTWVFIVMTDFWHK